LKFSFGKVKTAFLENKVNLKICDQIDQGKKEKNMQMINIRCKRKSIMKKATINNRLMKE
jgi:hypothetical protein